MRFNVRVVPNARQNKLVQESDRYKVYLAAPPVEGKANKALIQFLSEYFGIKKSKIKIVRGLRGRDKVVEIIK